MLSGKEIMRQMEEGNIVIEPFDEKCIAPNSYLLHIADKLVVYEDEVLECKKPCKTREIIIPEEGFVLQPGELYLGRTLEYTETRNFVPMLNGRVSIATLGITIHITAGFGDNGFCGTWTLEIFCIKPVRIYPGMKIGHLSYFPINGESDILYTGKYLGQIEPGVSKIYHDFSNDNLKEG